MWFLALIGLLILLLVTRERIYHWMKREYEAYQWRKKKREMHDRRCRNENIPKVSDWIDDFVSASDNLNRLVQRHIYLIEEIDHLHKQEAQSLSCGDITVCSDEIDHDDEKLKNLQHDVERTIQEIWLHKQALGHLVERLHYVPEAWDFWDYFFSGRPGKWASWCGIRGGCCGRQCNCCSKPRRTAAGESRSYWTLRREDIDNHAHCSEECGCCRQYWGFSRVSRADDGSLISVK